MRSFFKLPGTALLAAAALFAVVASSSTANAFTFRGMDPIAAAQNGSESVQNVAISRWDAWRARRDVVRALRSDCRDSSDDRSERRACYREAHDQLREMRHNARDAYRECRHDGGSRRDCRQAARSYWVDRAAGDTSDTGGSDEAPPGVLD